jgi:hypothetical protein
MTKINSKFLIRYAICTTTIAILLYLLAIFRYQSFNLSSSELKHLKQLTILVFWLIIILIANAYVVNTIRKQYAKIDEAELNIERLLLTLINGFAGGIALGSLAPRPHCDIWNFDALFLGGLIVGFSTWLTTLLSEIISRRIYLKRRSNKPHETQN